MSLQGVPDDKTVQQNRYVLKLNSEDEGYVAFDQGESTPSFFMSPEDYEDLGEPQEITVIVIPGDLISKQPSPQGSSDPIQ